MSEPKTCKCAAHSYAECICGAWDDLNPHTLKRERDEAVRCLREAIGEAGPYYDDPSCPQRGKEMIARWRKAAGIDTANTVLGGNDGFDLGCKGGCGGALRGKVSGGVSRSITGHGGGVAG